MISLNTLEKITRVILRLVYPCHLQYKYYQICFLFEVFHYFSMCYIFRSFFWLLYIYIYFHLYFRLDYIVIRPAIVYGIADKFGLSKYLSFAPKHCLEVFVLFSW